MMQDNSMTLIYEEWKLSTPIFSVGNQHLYEKFGYIETGRNSDEIFYCKKIFQ